MNTAKQTQPKKRTLSEIVEDFRRVLHGIDDLEGEVSPELEAQLNEVEATLTEKVDRCLWVAREAEAQAGVYTERAKALQDRARVLKRQSERLEDYVQWCLMTLNVPRLETPNFVASLAKTPDAVKIENEDNFVVEYAKVDTVVRITEEMFDLTFSKAKGYAEIVCNIPYSRLTFHPFIRNKLEISKKVVAEFLKSSGEIEGAALVSSITLRVK
jgi:hypothetical protein